MAAGGDESAVYRGTLPLMVHIGGGGGNSSRRKWSVDSHQWARDARRVKGRGCHAKKGGSLG